MPQVSHQELPHTRRPLLPACLAVCSGPHCIAPAASHTPSAAVNPNGGCCCSCVCSWHLVRAL
jgi:hypothetical protein